MPPINLGALQIALGLYEPPKESPTELGNVEPAVLPGDV